jgi:hypothetical protein
MKQILHFRIHPNILNTIRQAYWFEEDKQDWAMRCLHSLDADNKMTLDLAYKLLAGDAHFKTTDGGITLTPILKEDKKFKKDVKQYKEYQKLKKQQEKEEALEQAEEEPSLNQRIADLYSLGGSIVLDPQIDDEQHALQANMQLAKQMFVKKMMAKTDADRVAAETLMRKFRDTQYSFVFNGHQYTYSDSARNQSACPHCDTNSPDCRMWSDKNPAFIGRHDFGTGIYANCFTCPKCHKNFYYHTTRDEVD